MGAGMGSRVSRALLVGYRTSGQDNRHSGLSTTSGFEVTQLQGKRSGQRERSEAFRVSESYISILLVEVSWCLNGVNAPSTCFEDFQFLLPFSVQHQVVRFEPWSGCWPGKTEKVTAANKTVS